jgi:hypothetical protein
MGYNFFRVMGFENCAEGMVYYLNYGFKGVLRCFL